MSTNDTTAAYAANNLNLGGVLTKPYLSTAQLRILRIVALVCASTSLAACIVVLSWFVRMKRNFRHQMIMLLIISDSMKGLWQTIFPAVALANAHIETGSSFCTATGYLLATAIEASDYAILMIAIHSALSIFSPGNTSAGKSGLYKYRKIVYLFWVIFPILMASLAFINPGFAYDAGGTFCYLPVRPFWYRLALAWIPRYVVMLTITILYIAIYVYVKWTFRFYRNNFGSYAVEVGDSDYSRHNTETTRRGSHHSILGHIMRGSSTIPKEKPPHLFRGEVPATPPLGPSFTNNHDFAFVEKITPDGDSTTAPEDNVAQTTMPALLNPSTTLSEQSTALTSRQPSVSFPPSIHVPSDASDSMAIMGYDGSCEDRRGTSTTVNTETRMVRNKAEQENAVAQEVRRRHIRIQRQLRFLFIYPIVYMLTWLIPLINNGLQYENHYAEHPSFTLQLIVAVAVSIQGFIDCAFFTMRERPWRYIPPPTKQPWWSKLLRLKWDDKKCRESFNVNALNADMRRAYERREQERIDYEKARKERNTAKRDENLAKKPSRKASMAWWDKIEDSISKDHKTSLSRSSSQEPDAGGRSILPRSRSRSLSIRSGSKKARPIISAAKGFRPKLSRNKSSDRSQPSQHSVKEGDDRQSPTSSPSSPSSPMSPSVSRPMSPTALAPTPSISSPKEAQPDPGSGTG